MFAAKMIASAVQLNFTNSFDNKTHSYLDYLGFFGITRKFSTRKFSKFLLIIDFKLRYKNKCSKSCVKRHPN